MECYWKVILLLVSMALPALSFNTGAPPAACQTLAPDAASHGAPPQVTEIPYVLNLGAFQDQATNQMVYTPNIVYNGKTCSRVKNLYNACIRLKFLKNKGYYMYMHGVPFWLVILVVSSQRSGKIYPASLPSTQRGSQNNFIILHTCNTVYSLHNIT